MTPPTTPAVTRAVLRNGLTTIVQAMPGVGAVALHGFVKAGAVRDGDRPGHARFVATTLMHGTERRTHTQIAEALDAMGATLAVLPGLEVTTVVGRALADDLPSLLEVASEVLTRPAFPPDEVEKVRGQLITAARVNGLDTRHVAERVFRRLAYPERHPHAQVPDGDEMVLAALRPADLETFHERCYRPEATAMAVVGDVEAGQVVEEVARHFGGWSPDGTGAWPQSDAEAADTNLQAAGPRRHDVALPGKTQADLALGAPGVRRSDPAYYATMMANLLLGQLGMMGRVGENVRERQGMAYYAYSDLRAGLTAGPWWVRAGVNPANVERAVAAILAEIEALQRDGPAADELADARTFLIGSLAVRLETTQGLAQALSDVELHGLGLDYLDRYPSIIEGIGRDEIVDAIRRFPTDAYTLAVAGPERTP
jgi:zinc protease